MTGLTIDAKTQLLLGAVTLGTGVCALKIIGTVTGSTIGALIVLAIFGVATMTEVAMLVREKAALLTVDLVLAPWCAKILISHPSALVREVDCALGTVAPEVALSLLVVDWIIRVDPNVKMLVHVSGTAIGELVPSPV